MDESEEVLSVEDEEYPGHWFCCVVTITGAHARTYGEITVRLGNCDSRPTPFEPWRF